MTAEKTLQSFVDIIPCLVSESIIFCVLLSVEINQIKEINKQKISVIWTCSFSQVDIFQNVFLQYCHVEFLWKLSDEIVNKKAFCKLHINF